MPHQFRRRLLQKQRDLKGNLKLLIGMLDILEAEIRWIGKAMQNPYNEMRSNDKRRH